MKKLISLILTACMSALMVCMVLSMASCGNSSEQTQTEQKQETQVKKNAVDESFDVNISESLVYDHRLELDYAKEFAVDYYNDGYRLLTVFQDGQYLVVPEGKEVPGDLPENIVVVKEPKKDIYLVASAVMDIFVSLDAVDALGFSALKESDWYIDKAKKQMEQEKLIYAGKYSAPDYELIVSKKCSLAIENTMIYHNPEVKEELEHFGIPVMIDYSSYESEPMGRVEWVKFYAALLGLDEKADTIYKEQLSAYKEVLNKESTGKTVAFFYITSNGTVNVRKSTDYLPKMISLAGGEYVFSDLGAEDENASSTVSLQMEEFYAQAKDVDYIIYNSTIEGELSSVNDLIALSDLMKNFKAVQEGNVYCTSKNLYQSSMEIGTMIVDFYDMLHGKDGDMKYVYKLKD